MRVLFTTSKYPLSVWIRSATGEDVSHVALQFSDDVIIHATIGGVQMTTREHLVKAGSTIVHEVEIFDIPEEHVIDTAEKYLGNKYDYLSLLWCGIMYLIPNICKNRDNQWQNHKDFTCTEFVTEALYGTADSLITPGQLYMKLIKEKKNA